MNVDLIIPIGHLCVPSELLRKNGGKLCSFPFDWARSNIKSVIDVIKNGHDYHIENNIDSIGKIKYNYHFTHIFYPHHDYVKKREYMIRSSKRLFKALSSDLNIIFLYMGNIQFTIKDKELELFITTVKEKYKNLKFKVVIANFIGIGDSVKLMEETDDYSIYYCKTPKQFYSNPMNGNIYSELFKKIIPYKLNLKTIKLDEDEETAIF